jgi:hypothetical protein
MQGTSLRRHGASPGPDTEGWPKRKLRYLCRCGVQHCEVVQEWQRWAPQQPGEFFKKLLYLGLESRNGGSLKAPGFNPLLDGPRSNGTWGFQRLTAQSIKVLTICKNL